MFIGYLIVRVFVPESRSLKMRRQVVESLKQRMRNKFNVSVAEKPSDKWQRCELSFVYANYFKGRVCTMLDRLEDSIKMNNNFYIIGMEREVI